MKKLSKNELLNFMLLYARHYLASGGPTARLEDSITTLGNKFGYDTNVFATPTGVFISCQNENEDHSTALSRIKDVGINLEQICILERVLEDVAKKKISPSAATDTLRSGIMSKKPYAIWQTAIAACTVGFFVSYANYVNLHAAVVSALIALFTWFITSSYFKSFFPSTIFRDFAGAFFTLGLASLAQYNHRISIEAYSIGGIIILVPGLAITTAISDLAEQNLVSGTAKLMQAFLTLIAIGLAYVFFQEIAHNLHLQSVLSAPRPKEVAFEISLLSIIASLTSFGIIFKVPQKSLGLVILTGLAGWMTLQFLIESDYGIIAPYAASLIVGLVSLSFGRIFSLPSQIYSVPGIIGMLPGMVALSSFRHYILGNSDSGRALTLKVALTSISIVFGLLSARIPFQRIRAQRKKPFRT